MFTAKYYVDLIINDKNSNNKLCLPNMTIQNNKIIVFNEETKDKLFKDIQGLLKKEHNVDMSLLDIEELLKKCDDKAFDIYKGKSIYVFI